MKQIYPEKKKTFEVWRALLRLLAIASLEDLRPFCGLFALGVGVLLAMAQNLEKQLTLGAPVAESRTKLLADLFFWMILLISKDVCNIIDVSISLYVGPELSANNKHISCCLSLEHHVWHFRCSLSLDYHIWLNSTVHSETTFKIDINKN